MGNVYQAPEQTLVPESFKLMRLENIGTYALQPVWADGHTSGIYAFDYLRKVADQAGA